MEKPESLLYLEIAEAMRHRIAAGELRPGDRLPAVRQLALEWRCTPGTVNRAYTRLAEEGLVEGHRGGGTRVTANPLQPQMSAWRWATLVNRAERLLLEAVNDGFTAAQAQAALSLAIARWQALVVEEEEAPTVHPGPPAEREVLRWVGSHDLLAEFIARRLSVLMPEVEVQVSHVGSLGGLMALARDEADIAGVHLWDADTDSYNMPFVRRLLPGRRMALVTLGYRALGLIVPSGNPQQVQGLGDLVRAEVRWISRQTGSGTRVWLDAQLRRQGIVLRSETGARSVTTHTAVARAIAEGAATAGLGIQAAASAYGLDFVPLTRERYDLVIPAEQWERPVVQTLRDLVRSEPFKEAALQGYEMAEVGQEMWVE